MQPEAGFDVLVIGSGAAGLAAAVAAERAGGRVALATKGSIQANNSSKAQGGIQASFGEDDSPELHGEDVMRSSHDTADPRLVSRADEGRAGQRSTGSSSWAARSRDRTAATGSRAAAGPRASGCCRSATGRDTRSPRLFREAHEGGSATTVRTTTRYAALEPLGIRLARRGST